MIYLDSAQLAWLQSRDSTEREDFYSRWRAMGLELALSMTHLQEILQLREREEARRRLQVVSGFPVLRGLPYSAGGVRRFEASVQLRERLGQRVDAFREARAEMFPVLEYDDLAETMEEYAPQFARFSKMDEIMADLLGHVRGLRNLGGPPKGPIDRATAEGGVSAMIDGISSKYPHLRQRLEAIAAEVLETLEQAGGDVRKAKSMRSGLAGTRIRDRIPEEELGFVGGFFEMGLEVVPGIAEAMELPEAIVSAAVKDLDPYLAPGFRLQAAVRRARGPHPKVPTPSDETDEDHLVFAPYVDVLVVDKRTLGFVVQEEGKDDRLPSGSASSLRKVRDLDDLLDRLEREACTEGDASREDRPLA